MKTAIRVLLVLAVAGTVASAQSPDGDALSIYLVDVEGGGATLFVSPTGESMLMDTGNGGANADRDVSRCRGRASRIRTARTSSAIPRTSATTGSPPAYTCSSDGSGRCTSAT